jgi:N-acetylmuramoyl-L-alanine amidase
VREKDVVLAITRELTQQLTQDGRYKVVTTRAGDQFIPLKGRRDKARKLKADVFISIHADAFVSPAAKGASVFALSQRGATSEMARFLADHENSSDLLASVGGVSLDDKDEVLAGVLVDLSMTATLANSLDLGGRVLKELGRMTRLHHRSVEQAGFVVLKSPDVPSILVETGFISNPEEAAQLNSPAYRQKIARAIYTGVNSYFATQGGGPGATTQAAEPEPERARTTEPSARMTEPSARMTEPSARSSQTTKSAEPARTVRPDTPKIDPLAERRSRPEAIPPESKQPAAKPAQPGTKAAAQAPKTAVKTPVEKQPINHRVVPGDSLEKIARRYGVSQKQIIQTNAMPNSTVKLGQTLRIPAP